MRKVFARLIISIFVLSFMIIGVLAQNPNENKNTVKDCMKNATQQKNTDFKIAKVARASALSQANLIQDLEDRKTAREQAHNDFKTAIKGIKTAFKTARKACLF